MNAVTLSDLQRRFGDFVAVNRISLEVREGEIFGFLGPNGAGKSTTIRMLCGLLEPSSGNGTVAGFDIRTQREQIKQAIGYMSQRFSLYEDLTVEENIDFYSGIYRIPKTRKAQRKAWVLEMAQLQEQRHMRTGLLPGGWKQRLSLGCALLHEPRILFLDEPTSGVDPSSRRHFWELIHELAEGGVTVFVTTHYMEEAEYCDRLALIYRGEIIAMGTPTQLKESTALKVQLRVAAEARGGVEHFGPGPGKARTGTECGPECSIDPPSSLVLPHVVPRQSPATTSDTKTMPTLEDVFVALIEARDRQDGVQKEFQQ